MKHHTWNPEKNEMLKTLRDISFEDVVFYIEAGGLLDIVSHPDQAKYPEQKVYVVDIEGYIYLAPFIESDQEVFLKTIRYFPERQVILAAAGAGVTHGDQPGVINLPGPPHYRQCVTPRPGNSFSASKPMEYTSNNVP